MNNDSKIPGEFKYAPESKTAKKFDNFWYYHKWKVITAIFVIFVIAICVYSCVTRQESDIAVLYAGPYSSYSNTVPNMTQELTDVFSSVHKDSAVALNVLEIYSEEQIHALAKKEVDDYLLESGEDLTQEEINSLITRQENSLSKTTITNSQSLSSYLQMGNYAVYFLDPSIYEQYKSIGVFAKLTDVLGEDIPASAFSDDAIKLSETEFYKKNANGIGKLPENTLLCIRIKPIFGTGCGGEKSNDEEYNKAIDMFKAIVNYK